MKTIHPLLAALVAAFLCLNTYAQIDADIDISLGSEIGPGISGAEVMPFHGQLEVGYELDKVFAQLTPIAVYGHTSSADINGDDFEYHGEFYGFGVEAVVDKFFASAQVVKYYNNDVESESDPVVMLEAGVTSEPQGIPLRFGVSYENAVSGFVERVSLTVSYEFDAL